MNNIFTLPLLIFCLFVYSINTNELNNQNETAYEKNLNIATEYFLSKQDIPLDILVRLVPKDYLEFELYYRTTYPDHKMTETGFFHETTQLILEQVTSEKNNDFYLPSLKLISFADGEFAEGFIEHLELLIEMDKEKFCNSINGKEYVKHNPIKYYSELNKCD
ncbi:hypothetical protein BUL40_11690 [Croceivirga radicis]|uniref:Uncharacterized protein n=1 Tax=Croceivirga radicis TaxID=1929488 RepID=A0A1V6LPJ2_9FLAO|nr:hypothetical protein [Croceivirga radicis]OQD42082.1 hypothetical protein BUL40_11690 [Croceivirga radicis]